MGIKLATWRSDGRPIITPLGEGGVYVETINRMPGSSGQITYPSLRGLSLQIFQVYAGSYTWDTGVDSNGIPYINFNALPITYNGGPMTLMVFAE